MITFPNIDPVAFEMGPVAVHWYGITYIAGIGLAWLYLHRGARYGVDKSTTQHVDDLVFYAALGAVLGGRAGYVLFYNAVAFFDDPLSLFAVWHGGMSFHGGAVGLVLAMWWFARSRGMRFLEVTDFVLPAVPIGLGLGRIANFVNQELWGATTDLPWGVVFTHPAAGGLARHPSQLYEALLEGLCLFVILGLLRARSLSVGIVSAWFLILYAIFRGAVEFVREPDAHIGYIGWNWLTMGQLLSIPMLLAGIAILILTLRRAAAD